MTGVPFFSAFLYCGCDPPLRYRSRPCLFVPCTEYLLVVTFFLLYLTLFYSFSPPLLIPSIITIFPYTKTKNQKITNLLHPEIIYHSCQTLSYQDSRFIHSLIHSLLLLSCQESISICGPRVPLVDHLCIKPGLKQG